jgi:magnesium transporter
MANCVFAPVMLHERFHKLDTLGIASAIVGAVTVVLASNPSSVVLDPSGLKEAIMQWQFLVFTVIYIVLGCTLVGLSQSAKGQRWVWIDVGLCAIFGGFTVLSTKAVSTLLTTQGTQVFVEWIFYPLVVVSTHLAFRKTTVLIVLQVLVATGVGQIRYLNRALMRFDSKLVVPGQFVLFNLSAIVGSAILYQDFRRVSFHQMVSAD